MNAIIRPSADLRNKYNELSKFARENRTPIAITVNGREDTVLINYALYAQQMEELELLKAIAEAERDFESGLFQSSDNVFASLREDLKNKYDL